MTLSAAVTEYISELPTFTVDFSVVCLLSKADDDVSGCCTTVQRRCFYNDLATWLSY